MLSEEADASKRKSWELFAPRAFKTSAIARGGGKEKFVIFAVGDCVVDIGAGGQWQRRLVDSESEFAGSGESGKIGAEAVA